jgi:D-glycero-D-manno-heptose 1,7-bisphosphate phosphatase
MPSSNGLPRMISSTGVILAGGQGLRLRPLTETLPKPLTAINGHPFIAHLLGQMERLGFKRVIVLTGYLGESILQFCKHYDSPLEIICVQNELADSTAQRLLKNYNLIGDDFLLFYCDNFILDDEIVKRVLISKHELTFTIQKRDIGNVAVGSNGFAQYKAGQRSAESNYVELGYLKVNSSNFFNMLRESRDLPNTLSRFSENFMCGYVEVESVYWSISDLKRYLQIPQERSVVLLDRDGVLIHKMPKRKYLTSWSDYKPMHNNWQALRSLSMNNVDFVIVTNQPGVGTGDLSENFLLELHQKLAIDLLSFGINVIAIYVCPHHWNVDCLCRKPRSGMLTKAIHDLQIDLKRTLYIGDEDKDFEAAGNIGMASILIGREHSQSFSYESVEEALPAILKMLGRVD